MLALFLVAAIFGVGSSSLIGWIVKHWHHEPHSEPPHE